MANVVTAITSVFTELGGWIVSTISTLSNLFYSSTDGLTFIGVLAVCGLGVGLILKLVHVIRNFLRFR